VLNPVWLQISQNRGTAFFVSIPSETDPDIGYVYLVTARHCVEAPKRVGNLYIRVNLKAGGAAYIKGGPYAFETPPDDDASDVAKADCQERDFLGLLCAGCVRAPST
jgi:hypothetical protein